MIDKQLEMMASRAANFVRPSQRDKMPPKTPKPKADKPAVAGVEIGAERTAVKAPGKPAVEKSKEYVKPFAGNLKGAMQRRMGK